MITISPKEIVGKEVEKNVPKTPRRPKSYWANIPKHEIEALARCLFPDIQAYFESEDGKREFAEWQAQQGRKKKHT